MTNFDTTATTGSSAAAAAATASATTSNAAGSANSATAGAALGQNYQTFLQLLTTQLKNQDPLDPTDSSQFTNQLVLFSQVEQQINTNSNLTTLISAENNGVTSQALDYIGKDVATNSNAFTYTGNDINLGYTLPSASANTTVGIFNSNGVEVYATPGATSAGANEFTWNGKDSSGNAVADGLYTIQVSANDASNNPLTVTTQTPGTVTAVSNAGGTTYLTVNGQQIAESDVVSASDATTSSTN